MLHFKDLTECFSLRVLSLGENIELGVRGTVEEWHKFLFASRLLTVRFWLNAQDKTVSCMQKGHQHLPCAADNHAV